jgi:beta-lactamase class A
LSDASRAQLTAWLVANKTGDKRLRAGLPQDWKVGDKTGSGDNNSTNDVAILWPPGRAPVIVTAYYTGAKATDDERNTILADVGRFAAAVVT